jgi:hypothetical protein
LLDSAGAGVPSGTPEVLGAIVILAGTMIVLSIGVRSSWAPAFTHQPAFVQAAAYAALTMIALVFGPEGARFIYFQF